MGSRRQNPEIFGFKYRLRNARGNYVSTLSQAKSFEIWIRGRKAVAFDFPAVKTPVAEKYYILEAIVAEVAIALSRKKPKPKKKVRKKPKKKVKKKVRKKKVKKKVRKKKVKKKRVRRQSAIYKKPDPKDMPEARPLEEPTGDYELFLFDLRGNEVSAFSRARYYEVQLPDGEVVGPIELPRVSATDKRFIVEAKFTDLEAGLEDTQEFEVKRDFYESLTGKQNFSRAIPGTDKFTNTRRMHRDIFIELLPGSPELEALRELVHNDVMKLSESREWGVTVQLQVNIDNENYTGSDPAYMTISATAKKEKVADFLIQNIEREIMTVNISRSLDSKYFAERVVYYFLSETMRPKYGR
jgi:hypothetical protein